MPSSKIISTDREILVQGVHELLDVLEDWIELVSNFDWDGTQGFLPIVQRSALTRQFESLGVINNLVGAGQGFAAVSLLRSSCEELLMLRYIKKIDSNSANKLIDCYISSGLLNDLEAQAGEVGIDVMYEMGLGQHLEDFKYKQAETVSTLQALGGKLGWPKRFTNKGKIPSTWYFAKESGSEDLYRFLYHATSRYVHFSPAELSRRGWGKEGKLTISSFSYEPHWAIFSLQWGARLFGYTLEATMESLTWEGVQNPPDDLLVQVFKKICSVPLIPLITSEELRWENAKNET